MTTRKPQSAQLILSESLKEPGIAAPWIGHILVLGSRAARYHRSHADRQLVITISVPTRNYAAALIGCGWVLASDAQALPNPLDTLRAMEPGQALRAVNNSHVITGTFACLDEAKSPPEARFADSRWRVDDIRALAPLAQLETHEREPRPEPGSLECMALLDHTWDARLAFPLADLAMIGTSKWLNQDFDAYLATAGDDPTPSSIRALLRPKVSGSATWYTRLFASASLADHLPLPNDLKAVILDGNGAIKYLGDIEAPVVVCVLDRSVSDESAAELVRQLRNTRGAPKSVEVDLGWPPPRGVEALAFTMAL